MASRNMIRPGAGAPILRAGCSYRYRTAVLIGPWRSTRDQAIEDALRAGQLRRDPAEPIGFRWSVHGAIEVDRRSGKAGSKRHDPPVF